LLNSTTTFNRRASPFEQIELDRHIMETHWLLFITVCSILTYV